MSGKSLATSSPIFRLGEQRVCYTWGTGGYPCQSILILNMDMCSLKYHRLHPEYIHQRIERLGHSYSLRILLLLCDIVIINALFLWAWINSLTERTSRCNTRTNQGTSMRLIIFQRTDFHLDVSNQQRYNHGSMDVRRVSSHPDLHWSFWLQRRRSWPLPLNI